MWHTSKGIIKYDPHRFQMKRKTEWWAVMNVDTEITRHARWWVKRQYHVDLAPPSWDAHTSIIRGEKPPPDKMHLWKKYDGKRIDFKYTNIVRQSGDTTTRPGNYWFVEVDCPLLSDIRHEFGFPHEWKLHITIGRTWHEQHLICPPPPLGHNT